MALDEILHDFRPDIIFCIDHFRWETVVPDQIIFLTWVQDLLPNIVDRESAAKIGRNDFVLNAFVSDVEMLWQLGYPPEVIIEAAFAVNDGIYKPCRLSRPERDQYGADIGAFSNTGNPAAGLAEVLRLYSGCTQFDTLVSALRSAYWKMYRDFYREEICYSLDDYQRFLSERLEDGGLSLATTALQQLALIWREEVEIRIPALAATGVAARAGLQPKAVGQGVERSPTARRSCPRGGRQWAKSVPNH